MSGVYTQVVTCFVIDNSALPFGAIINSKKACWLKSLLLVRFPNIGEVHRRIEPARSLHNASLWSFGPRISHVWPLTSRWSDCYLCLCDIAFARH